MSDDKIVDLQGKPVDLKSVPSNQGDTMNKGIYTDDQMDEMYPPFQVVYERGFTQDFTHSKYVVKENGLLFIYQMPNESWLKGKLVQIIKQWILIEYYDRGDNPF